MQSSAEENSGGISATDSPRMTPPEVFEALQAKYLDEEHQQLRKAERYPWATRITIWARRANSSEPGTVELDSVTTDVSRCGVSFFYLAPIKIPMPVSIRFNELADLPVLDGVTRNVTRFADNLFQIGVEFID